MESTDHKKLKARSDENDLIIVFNEKGQLVGSTLLTRPTEIETRIGKDTASRVFNNWNNQNVTIGYNTSFVAAGGIPYVAIHVKGNENLAWIDMHKREETNGCYFLNDPTTPNAGDPNLETFEPRIIKDIMKELKISDSDIKKIRQRVIGKMSIIDIK